MGAHQAVPGGPRRGNGLIERLHCTNVELLSAVTVALVTALGLGGCGSDDPPAQISSARVTPGIAGATTSPTAAPLPAPEALTGVLYRLADTSIPAEQKLGLVQYATAEDQAALANFGQALADGGFRGLTVEATDLTWSGTPNDVIATVTLGAADDPAKRFTFPMEFSPIGDNWQLTRRTADQLLQLSASPSPAPPGSTPPR
jgi:hypothetical protein